MSQQDNYGGGYDGMQQSQQNDMGGGRGAMGSGVSGGYEGNQQPMSQNQNQGQGQSQNQSQGQGQGQQNWLDKGIESLGQKAGFSVSNQQADSAGNFIDKESDQYTGHNLPGVQQ